VIFQLDRGNHTPLYAQIVSQVRRMMADGTLKMGDRLPANRELAKTLGVNRTTVTNAYAELTADGLISSEVGRGTFVCAIPEPAREPARSFASPSPMPWSALLTDRKRDLWLGAMLHHLPSKDAISLAYSLPPADLFPLEDFRRCVDRVLRREGRELLQLGMASGYGPLQEYLVSQMALSGIHVKPEEVLITNGAQQSLDLIRQILVEPTEEVAIEDPTYPGALSIFCGGQSRHISIPVTSHGIDLGVLEDILSQRRPKLIYTIPSFHNPTGVTMDISSRRALLELAARHRVPIVEDDIYSQMRYNGPALPPLKALDQYGLVIYVNSFSKMGFPGLRVGWIAAPRVVIEHLSREKERSDLHASMLAQAALYEFSRHGLLAKHVKKIKKAYGERRDRMLAAMDKHFPAEAVWSKPDGGMSIWVTLPEQLNASQILLESAERGVTFSPGEHFYASLPRLNMMRLSFTMATPSQIDEAIKRLGAVIKNRLLSLRRRRARGAESFRALV
jgi:GntR family transcriptional regulator/MocR family aminotransferase